MGPHNGRAPLEDDVSVSFSDKLPTLKHSEELLVSEALKRAKGNQTVAARMLGITRQALNRRVRHNK
jgi:DNA-binding protein Fis